MKKLVLLLAVVFSVSLFSCGGSEAGKGSDSDSVKAKENKEVKAPEKAPETAPTTGDTLA